MLKAEDKPVPEPWLAMAFATPPQHEFADPAPGDLPGDLDVPFEQVGPYLPLRLLGRGGQGEVYVARDTRFQRMVALKILRGFRSPRALERMRREAELASRLDHPGICPVYDASLSGAVPYLAMRLIEGSTLARELKQGGDPASGRGQVCTRTELVEKVAHALHEAHEAGIVHRDVKPQNIMITPGGEPVILDFGLARDLGNETETLTLSGETFGTPAYMSPEQIRGGSAATDRRSDVFSLGVTLFESLTGSRPFEGPTREMLLSAILTRPPRDVRRLNRHVTADLAVVLTTAMEKDPARRYQTAEALAEDLRRVRSREPILARRVGTAVRSYRWMQRHPLASSLICLLGISQVALAVAMLTAGRNEAIAAGHLRRLDLISAADRLELAGQAERRLYPAWPHQIQGLEQWLVEYGEPLTAQISLLGSSLDELRGSRSAEAGAGDRLGIDYLEQMMAAQLVELESFAGPAGPVAHVRLRLAEARRIHRETIDSFSREWRETLREIRASPRYGFELSPQVGLIPLGRNPVTGLFEFHHLRSSSGHLRHLQRRQDGSFEMTGETGIVFVLVPGGDTYVGVQGDDPQAPYYDPTQYHIHPLQAVTLEPFFISKYEMTQGQWSRLSGEGDVLLPGPDSLEPVGVKHRPSYFNAANREEHDLDRLPVEQVSPIECDALLASHGLALPTEVQWEYAGRAGTHTRWHTGEDPSSLLGYENLGPDLADEHLLTAPVGSFRPNRFGLYDVAGNVSEWCRDRNGSRDGRPPRPGDGLRPPPLGRGGRVIRGANYSNVLSHARIGVASSAILEKHSRAIGVRAVRAVLP